jgi:hypothetical protein
MFNDRMPAPIAAASRSAPAAGVEMTHDDYLAKLQADPYFRPVKPAASEPTPGKLTRPEAELRARTLRFRDIADSNRRPLERLRARRMPSNARYGDPPPG